MGGPIMDFSEVERARALLRHHLAPTRLVEAASLGEKAGARVYLKLESEAPTGSFKVRGALNALYLKSQQGELKGVITASTGNHGAAVAYAAQRLGLPATVFLPQNPNPIKRARIVRLGARIQEAGRDYDDARSHAAAFARQQGWYFLEDGRDPRLTPGPATIGSEIVEQLPDTEVIYVPIGDSTLIRGLAFAAKHLKPAVRVVGVQAERAPAYFLSWEKGRAENTDSCDTIADGLAVRCTVAENVQALRTLVEEMRLVSDEGMLAALYRLLVDEHVLAEPAGAASTAAFLASGRKHAGQTVVLVVTGANITPEILRQAVRKG